MNFWKNLSETPHWEFEWFYHPSADWGDKKEGEGEGHIENQ